MSSAAYYCFSVIKSAVSTPPSCTGGALFVIASGRRRNTSSNDGTVKISLRRSARCLGLLFSVNPISSYLSIYLFHSLPLTEIPRLLSTSRSCGQTILMTSSASECGRSCVCCVAASEEIFTHNQMHFECKSNEFTAVLCLPLPLPPSGHRCLIKDFELRPNVLDLLQHVFIKQIVGREKILQKQLIELIDLNQQIGVIEKTRYCPSPLLNLTFLCVFLTR